MRQKRQSVQLVVRPEPTSADLSKLSRPMAVPVFPIQIGVIVYLQFFLLKLD